MQALLISAKWSWIIRWKIKYFYTKLFFLWNYLFLLSSRVNEIKTKCIWHIRVLQVYEEAAGPLSLESCPVDSVNDPRRHSMWSYIPHGLEGSNRCELHHHSFHTVFCVTHVKNSVTCGYYVFNSEALCHSLNFMCNLLLVTDCDECSLSCWKIIPNHRLQRA